MEKENQKALGRVGEVFNHLSSQLVSNRDLENSPTAATTNSDLTSVFGKVGSVSDEDIVVVSALRTPIGKAKRGGFKDTTPDTLLTAVFKETLNRTKVDGNIVGDIVVGNVQTVGSYSMPARAAMFMAGLPITTTVRSVNRQCSSGLQAVASIASEIKAGYIDVGIGAGVESMTHGGNPSDPSSLPPMSLESIFENPLAKDCLIPMGITSENVAAKYNISREDQDAFSMSSHVKALEAIKNGKFKDEIVPVGDVSQDEGPRETTIDKLAKLKPAFDPKGSTTAGNASQVSDGAAAVLLMKRSQAKKLGLPILGIFRGFKVAGVPPSEMGVGPAFAIPELMKATSQNVSNIDLWEINEAFASQALYCVRKLGIDVKKVNVNGGAIALGHPLGMTGARQVATLLHEMNRRKKEAGGKNGQWKTGVVSMCIGTGMGAAALFEVQ